MDILRDFLSFVPGHHVFHYADVKGLRGIVASKAIWATNILNLNDPSELRYSIELAQNQIESLKQSKSREDVDFLNSIAGLLNAIHEYKEYGIYVASFCEDGGDRQSQWQGYGNDGNGFSIGFNFSQDDGRRDLQRLQPCNRFRFHFAKCEYEPTKQAEIIRTSLVEALDTFHQTQGIGRAESADMLASSDFLLRFLYQIAPRLKGPRWEKEQERRLVLRISFDDQGVQIRQKGESSIRYIEFKLADETTPVRFPEVLIGPCVQGELSSESAVRDLLSRNGIDCPSVRRSKIPYQCL